jgi:DNA primase
MKEISDKMKERIYKIALIDEVLIAFKFDKNLNSKCCFNSTEKNCEIKTDKEKQIFKCYKCGEGGDIIQLVMKSINLSYPDALLWLQNRYDLKEGIPSNCEIEKAGYELYLYFLDLYKNKNIQIDECSFLDGFNFGADYCKSFFEKTL